MHSKHAKTNIPIEQLRTFIACVDHDSFTKAAQTLNITQSAVSAQIKKLSGFLGGDVFSKTKNGFRMTKRGEDLEPDIDHARRRGEQVTRSRTLFVCHRGTASHAGSATQFTCLITLPTLSKISPIWSSLMISGGESAMVSPVMRNIRPCSWKAFSIES